MRRMLKGRGSALAIAMAVGLAVTGAGVSVQPAYAQGKKGEQGNSPAFVAAAQPLLEKVNAAVTAQQGNQGDAQVNAALAGAPAMLAQAEAAVKTPRDRLMAGQLAMQIGLLTNDSALAQRGIKAMLASGQLDAAQTAQMQQTLQKLAAVPQADPLLTQVDSYVQANNPNAALAQLRKAVSGAGTRQVPEAYLMRGIQIADKAGNAGEALFFSSKLAEQHPSNLTWLTATQVLNKYGSQEPQDKLDVFRLMSRSGGLNAEPRFTGREYADYADAANLRGYYSEAVKVIDQGRATGALTGTQGNQIRAAASGKLSADRASLPSQERDARAAGNGIPALATADAYLNYGEAAKAEELYRLALQKGGLDADRTNRALTRLGIAQFDQGKYAEARESFGKVSGQRAQLARLWLVLVNQKSGARAG